FVPTRRDSQTSSQAVVEAALWAMRRMLMLCGAAALLCAAVVAAEEPKRANYMTLDFGNAYTIAERAAGGLGAFVAVTPQPGVDPAKLRVSLVAVAFGGSFDGSLLGNFHPHDTIESEGTPRIVIDVDRVSPGAYTVTLDVAGAPPAPPKKKEQ